MTTDLKFVRNIGIAAHVDAGKTTLTERTDSCSTPVRTIELEKYMMPLHIWIIFQKKRNMVSPLRQPSLVVLGKIISFKWVDTPGHVDFTIEVERSMRVLDGAVIVMDGVRGVEPQTETVWSQANKVSIPRVIFINKMDKPGADFEQAMETVSRTPQRQSSTCLLSFRRLLRHQSCG